MLSQSHPSYLSQLRMNLARTKGGSDMALLYLTVISIAVLCCQAVTGKWTTQRFLFGIDIVVQDHFQ
jgi:magnesium transporter